MRSDRRLLVGVLLALALSGAAGAALAVSRGPARAVLTEEVLDSMDRLLESPVPAPRSGDQRIGSGRYRSDEPCSAVQASYGGVPAESTFGWSATVEVAAGRAGIIGAPSEQGCMYEVTAAEPVEIIAPAIPGFGKHRAFAAVACSLSPLSGAVSEFLGPDGAPMVVFVAGEIGDLGFGGDDPSVTTSTLPDIGAEQQGSLRLYSGRYSQDGVGLSEVSSLDGTVVDLGDGYVFTTKDVTVTLLCTPADSTVLTPTDAG